MQPSGDEGGLQSQRSGIQIYMFVSTKINKEKVLARVGGLILLGLVCMLFFLRTPQKKKDIK